MTKGTDRIKTYRPDESPAVPPALCSKRMLTLVIAASLPGLVSANVAGKVDFAAGNVTLVYANGHRQTLTRGMSVSQGDTIRTGSRGLAQVRFTDGSYVSVQKNSAFRIDEYAYDPDASTLQNVAKKVNKGLFSLLEGGFRTVTGFLGIDNYSVKTPVATIGIRGTEYMAELGRSLTVHVADGALQVCNEAGCHFFRTNESGYVEDATQLIERLRDLGLDIVVSTERGETIASIEEDKAFRFKIHEEVDDNGTSSLLGETETVDCSNANCTAAFGWVQGGTFDVIHTTSTTATFNGDIMTSHDGGLEWTADSSGTTTAESAGSLSNLAWGRWTGGLTANNLDAVHYVIGTPTPNFTALTGTYTFNVVGYTNPTVVTSAGLGPFQQVTGSFDANFDISTVVLDFTVEFANASYSFVSGCSPLTISSAYATFSDTTGGGSFSVEGGPLIGSGPTPACQVGTCNGAVTGFFSGNNAGTAGLTYHVEDTGSSTDITGAVVFGKQ